MTTRITGGTLRGRSLTIPKGEGVRPTASRVREAVFSILGPQMGGLSVLDLCAGAGTLGIEAASRGAASVVFVENDREHVRALRKNLALLDGLAEHQVLQTDVVGAPDLLAGQGARFDLVFLDPPYASDLAERTLVSLGNAAEILAEGATLAVETAAGTTLPDRVGGWTCSDRRRWGRTSITLYTKDSP
jgi:16S rRNA (guanine(966)-N(2))-methyltransferase RsmD